MFGPVVRICGTIAESAMKNTRLPHKRLDELTDCHACRNRVRVNNNVGANSVLRKGHILLRNNQPDRSLLTATRAELIANGRKSFFANPDFPDAEPGLALRHKRLIHEPELSLLWHGRHIAHLPAFVLDADRPHPDDHFLIVHFGVFANEPIVVEVAVIITGFDSDCAFFLDIREPGIALCAADAAAFFACFIHVVVCDSKHSALDARFIEKNRILDIISVERHNRDDGVETAGVFFMINEVQIPTLHDGDFAVIEDNPHFINTHLVVAVIN